MSPFTINGDPIPRTEMHGLAADDFLKAAES